MAACCPCNGSRAKCVRCSCVRAGRLCVSCKASCCSNRPALQSQSPLSTASSPSQLPQATTCPTSPSGGAPISQPPTTGATPDSGSCSSSPPAPSLPSLISVVSTRVFTLPHVPKGARDAWAGTLAQELRSTCSSPQDPSKWTRLLLLAKCILLSPSIHGRRDWKETLQLVRDRLKLWAQGRLGELWEAVLFEAEKLRSSQSSSPPSSDLSIRRAKKALEEGQNRKAMQALSSKGLAPNDDATFQSLLNLHPQVPPPSMPPSPAPPSPSLSAPIVLSAIDSFPGGSSPGPSGLRPSHLKEAVHCPSAHRALDILTALTSFCQLASGGSIPSEVVPLFCGASLIASLKKNGGIRPIAIGETLRRLISKCLAHVSLPIAANFLSPLQVGVGVAGGAEAIIHAIKLHLSNPDTLSSDKPTLLVDFTNAFNSINRVNMFREIRKSIPSLSAWFECCYGSAPVLQYNDKSILSCTGVQQGDPLGPLGFAIAIHPLIQQLSSITSLCANAWYLDDGSLSGDISGLQQAVDLIETVGPSMGLSLNRGKCLLYVPPDLSPPPDHLPSGIPTSTEGFILLGAPVGPPSLCSTSLYDRISSLSHTLSLLPGLQDSQMETTLLRSCLSLPKLSMYLRTCDPTPLQSAYTSFDSLMRSSLSESVGACLSDWSWLKGSLPISMGGLGLRQASLHAPAAYYASLCSSASLVEEILHRPPNISRSLDSYRPLLTISASRPDWVSHEAIDTPLSQHSLSSCINKSSFSSLLATAPTTRCRALALSTSISHAGDWLIATPSHQLGLHFLDQEFRLAARYWLGSPISSVESSCSVCSAPADVHGDHHVGCRGNRDLIRRHDTIRDVLFAAAQSAALAPRKEIPSLIPGSSSRPADIFLPQWKGGRAAALDVTVISPLQAQTVANASVVQGSALTVADARKMALHAAVCHRVGVSFIPLAMEALGGWSKTASSTIADIGRKLGQRLGRSTSETQRHLFQRLSVALWRGNAAMWATRGPPLPPSLDGLL